MSDEKKENEGQEEAVNVNASSDVTGGSTTEQSTASVAERAERPERKVLSDEEKEAKAKAAAEARAARAAARTGKAASETEGGDAAAPEAPKEPSPKQPVLDRLVQIIKDAVSPEAIEEAFINERDDHLPTVVIKNALWPTAAELLKQHSELKLHYLRNVSGVDLETHMEVVYFLISFSGKQDYCVKVKTNREQPSVLSVTHVWPTANWNEREIYDLLGIDFPGHPDLRRIMLPDDWVGHPLRKDYQPLDPEV